jgi:TRAP-type C4-dicarboxylate transport system permease small subunit
LHNTGANIPDLLDDELQPGPALRGLVSVLQRLEDALLIGLFSAMLGMAVLQIVLRVGFSSGIVWGDVMVRILVLWICLLGAMTATRQDRHINIDVLTRYLPDRFRNRVAATVRLVTSIVCLLMTWEGVKLVRLDYVYRTTAFAAVPAWLCEVIIPVGFFVMALRYIFLSLHYISGKPEPKP